MLIRGTTGYAEQADELVARYEAIDFADKHRAILQLLPAAPADVLDVGAGSGADAAWLARRGYNVVAVEPTAELRTRGMALHPSPSIEWVDDSLPRLDRVFRRGQVFDLITLTAVWMHLDGEERRAALAKLAGLLARDGVIVMTIRHGPVPRGRIMFAVSPAQTVSDAQACGLTALFDAPTASVQAANRDAGVTWSQLVLGRSGRRAGGA